MKETQKPQVHQYNGIGFFGLLTILFIALKLTGYITWSWFWVLSPLIFVVSLWFLIFAVIAVAVWLTTK